MLIAETDKNEEDRLLALGRYNIMDTVGEQCYDDITYLASLICNTPIALVSLVDDHRQWFKSKVGIDVSETNRDIAFCSHTIVSPTNTMIVPDALEDERFIDNPLVTNSPDIRFYAGTSISTYDGFNLGSVCVIDTEPRELTEDQIEALRALARQTIAHFESRKTQMELDVYRKNRKQELIKELAVG